MTAFERELVTVDLLRPAGARVVAIGARQRSRYHGWRRHVKRSADLAIVLLTAPVTVPVAAALALAVRVTSRGPVLFRQERVGRGGERVEVLKFRTMVDGAEQRLLDDPLLLRRYLACDYKLSVADDPRITWFGRFLRRSSLDELPQLWNVLTGTMSLVGPRPIVVGELSRYGALAYSYLEVVPGITGSWQTSGRNNVSYPQRADLDVEYLRDWTLLTDVRILLRTVPCVLRRHGSD